MQFLGVVRRIDRDKIERLIRQAYREMSQGEHGSTQAGQAVERLSQILLGPVWADRATRRAPLQRLVVVPESVAGSPAEEETQPVLPIRLWSVVWGTVPPIIAARLDCRAALSS